MTFEILPINGETWLICGGRDFSNAALFDDAMRDIVSQFGCPGRIVHGGAKGADTLANNWGVRLAIEVSPEPADWEKHGKAAGPIRNGAMLSKHNPIRVVAFPGGRGTADMVRKAKAANIQVIEIRI